MTAVVKRTIKYGGICFAVALLSGKFLGPLIGRLQKNKIEESILDESIIRRFEQALAEGKIRYEEEYESLSGMIKSYFDIEGLTERLRTCRQEDKKELWNNMKILVFARLFVSIYVSYSVLILSKVEMVIVSKYLSRNSSLNEEIILENCRSFMADIKGFFAVLVAEICPIMIEVSKNILDFTNIDSKIEDLDCIKTIMMQLKRRADASISISSLLQKNYNSQLQKSQPMEEILSYTKCHNFQNLLDYMICDGLEDISINGFDFLNDSMKPKIMLSWISYASAIFNSCYPNSIEDLLTKKWKKENLIFSHLAVLFCE